MEIKKLASEIIEGRRLTRTDDLSFFKDADRYYIWVNEC